MYRFYPLSGNDNDKLIIFALAMRDNKPNKDFVFGIQPVSEALKSDQEIERIYIQKGLKGDHVRDIVKECRNRNIPCQNVPIEKLNKITRKNHQGLICLVSPISYSSIENVIENCYNSGNDPFILILDRITDVRNFGAISRTAECAGVNAILIPDKGAAQINSDALKTSSGALNHIPVCRTHNLKDGIEFLKNSGLKIISCTEKTEDSLFETDLSGPVAIILGSEENGISPEYLKLSDARAKIPINGAIDSLNVSVAAGVIMYEAIRQRS